MALDNEGLAIVGVVGVMGLNQLVMRLGALYSRPVLFYGLQVINLGVGSAIVLLGLPGFERMPVVSWFLGLLFFFRTVQNNGLRQQWLRAARRSTGDDPRRDEILAALRRGDDAGEAEEDEEEEETV